MTVDEFMDYSIDKGWQEVHIYDTNLEEEKFVGTVDEMPDKYLYGEIDTFDVINKESPILTLNVIPDDYYDEEEEDEEEEE